MSEEKIKDTELHIPTQETPKPCKDSCHGGCYKLDTFDWLEDLKDTEEFLDVVEVRFKNTRKSVFSNPNKLRLKRGDIVAVEASPGHDIGTVSMVGELMRYKLNREKIDYKNQEFKKVYRKAKPADKDKWEEAKSLEYKTMIKSRRIAEDLNLNMKIGDVEYQGDKTKAIFYYIADERVDFRELIKVLAEQFRVRIEMRQIGARQEAGRIGGIGACGRELCCASWMHNFVSVTTNAARYQEVSLNPQKLAGQCSKLKCCLNYELESYLDAQKDFPKTNIVLQLKDGSAKHQKTDVFKRVMWYSYEIGDKRGFTCMSVEQVKEIIEMNKRGKRPEKLTGIEDSSVSTSVEYQNAVGLESLTRFEDKPSTNKRKKKPRKKPGGNRSRHRQNPKGNKK